MQRLTLVMVRSLHSGAVRLRDVIEQACIEWRLLLVQLRLSPMCCRCLQIHGNNLLHERVKVDLGLPPVQLLRCFGVAKEQAGRPGNQRHRIADVS